MYLFKGLQEPVERSTRRHPLYRNTVVNETASCFPLRVVGLREFGESKHLGDVNLLPSWEFELGTTKSFHRGVDLILLRPHRQQHLANVHPCRGAVTLTKRTSHPGLQPIRTGTGQHLVDADDVEWVRTHSEVEKILSRVGDHVFVRSNSSSFERFRGYLLVLIGDHVHGSGEVIHMLFLPPGLIDPDLRIRDTTAVPRFRVRLVLTIPITLVRPSTHGF